MKRLTFLLGLTLAFFLLAGHAAAQARDQVKVTFKTATSKSFVQTLSTTFRARIIKQESSLTYLFEVPALKSRDQYAELFASLPSVASTDPVPLYKIADHIQPQAVHVQPLPNAPGAPYSDGSRPVGDPAAYMPQELLVKFKAGVSADDIRFLNQTYGASQLSRISGIDVYRLRLPKNLGVEEAMALYGQSELVEYAEPNYTMGLPQPPTDPAADAGTAPPLPGGTAAITPIPLDGGGQMLVYFKPGTGNENVQRFHQIFGTREVKKQSFYAYRVQLPAGLNPAVAARIFKLYPHTSNVQRLYS
ncbi:MAG: hypothetical protein IGS03_00020 [Candidatus Sericytochromatia bacterium]|nr:hypothetical protein [Candidatus Sericytochromatia bacterium]